MKHEFAHDAVSRAGMALFERPFVVMGIVNVTPDSFYDGGRYAAADAAVAHALRLVEQGAAIIDIGGQSTRPGAATIGQAEELDRVVPVIRMVRARSEVCISVDTTSASVARAALENGADWINDISAGRFDSRMPEVAARYDCPVVLMHSRKTPADMQDAPRYEHTVAEIKAELSRAVAVFERAGVSPDAIVLDPGIGFAKRLDDNLEILRHADAFVAMGRPVIVGASRKSFIGEVTGKGVDQRLSGSLAAVAACYRRGVRGFRVHDVAETVDFLKMLSVIETHR
jgi:dihydropteroate synthase